MDVYHNGSFRGKGKKEMKLDALPVQRAFLWENQEIYIPAIYAGKAGAVLDVCVKIPTEAMAAFLQKWNKERRLSLQTNEEYEQLDADNPGCQKFLVQMSLDDVMLKLSCGGSINWYPEHVFQMGNENPAPACEEEWKNDLSADLLMEAYDCDRNCCWHFGRFHYYWNEDPILAPQKIALTFQAQPISVTIGHFTTTTDPSGCLSLSESSPLEIKSCSSTDTACNGNTIITTHPVTGQEYTLTLCGCEQMRHSFANIGAKGMVYPEYSQVLSYRICPEIDRSLFDIRDCSESDPPKAAVKSETSDRTDGAAAIFMAGKSTDPKNRMAASSLHFEPVSEIRWRMVFQVKTRADKTVCFT